MAELGDRTVPYRQYLKSAEWRNKRAQALAGRRCQLCNSPDELHVYHRSYERLGHELPSDLVVLCGPCHRRRHRNVRAEDRGAHRKALRSAILTAVEAHGCVSWSAIKKQLGSPTQQSWAQAQKLIRQRKLAWCCRGKRLCLYEHRDLYPR